MRIPILCLDPFHLKKVVIWLYYQAPTLEESKLTTFWTPKGRFCWTYGLWYIDSCTWRNWKTHTRKPSPPFIQPTTSRTLTPTQTSYAQIEKESLAILFGLQRFKQYGIERSDVLVETDHKRLESIFKKPLKSAPKMLQRMLLSLQWYNFKYLNKPVTSIDHHSKFLSRETHTIQQTRKH